MTAVEEWRRIPEAPDYAVSDLGRVASFKRHHGTDFRILRGAINGPYKQIQLRTGGGGFVNRLLHHLVAEAFHGPRPAGAVIRHLDGDSLNNAASNLVYGTQAENNLDTVRHGRHHGARKTHCRWGHELTPENLYANAKSRQCRTCCASRRAARKQQAVAA